MNNKDKHNYHTTMDNKYLCSYHNKSTNAPINCSIRLKILKHFYSSRKYFFKYNLHYYYKKKYGK